MRKSKLTAFLLVLVIFVCFFTSCSYSKYNAVMYSMSEEWILTSFLEDNKVRGAYYKNPDYGDGADDSGDEYYYDETSPQYRVFIINDQDTYNAIFKEDALTVDFDKETVYLYIFADVHPNREYYICDISLEKEKVNIYFKLEHSNKKGATAPYQRSLIVKMDKNNASTVEFIKQK